MNLNRPTIMAMILLLSTVVGFVFLPIGGWSPKASLLMYVGLGLALLQTAFLLAVLSLTVGFALTSAVRGSSLGEDGETRGLDHLRVGVLALTLKISRRLKPDRQYSTSEQVLMTYRTVSIFWWTLYLQLAFVYVLHFIHLIVISVPFESIAALVLFVDWIFFVAIAAALYMAHTMTYRDRVSDAWRRDLDSQLQDREALQELKLTPCVGAIVIGLIAVVPLNSLYWILWVFE